MSKEKQVLNVIKFLFNVSLIFLFFSVTAKSFPLPGDLDITFNSNRNQPGTASTAINSDLTNSIGNAVAIQADGKIVVAGTAVVNGINMFALSRFNQDGTLDISFNSSGQKQGTLTIGIEGENVDAQGYSVAIQSQDQKIVVAGVANVSGAFRFAVARFNTDGSLDTTFNPSPAPQPGTASTTIEGEGVYNWGQSLAIQSDGKIVVVGSASIEGKTRFGVARFTSSGALDTSFNSSGPWSGTKAFTIDGVDIDAAAYCVAIQPSDNKIVIVGYANVGSNSYRFAVARLKTNGDLDDTFNQNGAQPGTVVTKVDNLDIDDLAYSVAIDQDGKIVLAGYVNDGFGMYKLGLARLNTDGSLDTTFNSSSLLQPGTLTMLVDNSYLTRSGVSIVFQEDGKIVTGQTAYVQNFNKFSVARLNQDGSPDRTFKPGGDQPGTVSTTIENIVDNTGQFVALQSDGKIVIAGYAYDGVSSKFGVARFIAKEDTPPTPAYPTANLFSIAIIKKYGRILS